MADPINVIAAAGPRSGLALRPQRSINELVLSVWGGDDWDEGEASVRLQRPEVEQLRDQLTAWLDRSHL